MSKKKKVYEVVIKEIATTSIFVAAYSKEQAENIAFDKFTDDPGEYSEPDYPDYKVEKVVVSDGSYVDIDVDDFEDDEDDD